MGAAVVAKKMDELMADARAASESVMVVRDEARDAAVRAIRSLLAQLKDAVAGDTLRGMATLSEGVTRGSMLEDSGRPDYPRFRSVDAPLMGARVRGTTYGIDSWLRPDGRETLVITKDADLVSARIVRDHAEGDVWMARPVRDDELQAQDLEPIVGAVQRVLERHVARAEKTAGGYAKALALAGRLAQAFGWGA